MDKRRVAIVLFGTLAVALAATQKPTTKPKVACLSSFYKAECFAHSKLANISCSMTPVNTTANHLSLNFTFFQEELKLTFRWKQYQKMGNNRYVPGFFDMTFDMCDTLKNLETLPRTHPLWVYGEHLNPRLIENIKRYARPCPFVGPTRFEYLTMAKPLIGPLKLMPAADFRSEFILLNAKFALVTLRMYSSTNKTITC